jgi:hypothetical protein
VERERERERETDPQERKKKIKSMVFTQKRRSKYTLAVSIEI